MEAQHAARGMRRKGHGFLLKKLQGQNYILSTITCMTCLIRNESGERNSHQEGNTWTMYVFGLDSIQLRGKVSYLE